MLIRFSVFCCTLCKIDKEKTILSSILEKFLTLTRLCADYYTYRAVIRLLPSRDISLHEKEILLWWSYKACCLFIFQGRNVLMESNVNSTIPSEPNSPIVLLQTSFERVLSSLLLLRNNLQLAPVLCLDSASCWWRIWRRN